MSDTRKEILNTKEFKSIIQCIEYLYHAGFDIKEAYQLAYPHYNPIINVSMPSVTHEDDIEELLLYSVVQEINGCEIRVTSIGVSAINYMKGEKIVLSQNLKSNKIFHGIKDDQDVAHLYTVLNQLFDAGTYRFQYATALYDDIRDRFIKHGFE